MPRNLYPDKGVPELLVIREAILQARQGGQVTHSGIAPGIYHEFAAMKPWELNKRLDEVDYALWDRTHLDDDPILAAKYPNPYASKVMAASTIYRRSY